MSHPPVVSILGNSVPLLIQPLRQDAAEQTYAEILLDRGWWVVNGTKQSAMVTDVYAYLEDECIRHFPDYVILHFGIVEATYRARPRWLQNIFSMNAWNNSVINKGYNGPITRGVKFVGKKFYRKTIERIVFTLGWQRRWVSPQRYRFVLRDICKRIFSDTPAKKIVVIGLPRVADWVEREAPGTNRSIDECNAIMKALATEYVNILWLDVAEMQKQSNAAISPDGIHLTANGHHLLAERLMQLMTGERQDYTGWQRINQYENFYQYYERWYKRPSSRSE